MRVVVGMSGGVDSAVAAYLLKAQGHDVIGVTLRTWESGGSRCCEIDDARRTAQVLGIPYHTINCSSDFERSVKQPFVECYLHGLTPNPCVLCNRLIKWEWLLYAAGVFQADAVASGHYVKLIRKENGRYTVRQAEDRKKDQSYMLYRLTQEQLSKTLFPLGDLTKEEVRHIAKTAGLPAAESQDSQEICFVTSGSYADFIRENAAEAAMESGNFVDSAGSILGRHKGIINYTVGQRKGLGLAMGKPVYVKAIRPETNEVVVAPEEEIYQREILCDDVHLMSIPVLPAGESLQGTVKIRYHHEGENAIIQTCEDNTVRILFDQAVKAPTPGQSAVFYDQEKCVIGGGIIKNGVA